MREVFDYALTCFYNMVKRKQPQNGELRSSHVPLTIHKYSPSLFNDTNVSSWNISKLQPYFPAIEKLFKISNLENITSYGLKFENEITSILGSDKIRTSKGQTVDIHKKITMIVSPYKWMRGEHWSTHGLPTSMENATSIMNKIQNSNNAASVGAIISSVLSESGCDHFPRVYGVFSGVSETHTIDISEDYGELSERPWFSQNIGKLFDVKLTDEIQDEMEFKHTRTSKHAIQLGDTIMLEGMIEELEAPHIQDVEIADINKVFNEDTEVNDNQSDSSSVSTSYIFAVNSCECSDDEDEDDEMTCEPFAWATFKNAPVEVTVMEKCNGTLYELLMKFPEPEKHLAWLSQVMFALAYAQRNFGLTHNDLHANNIMYVPTDKEYYYYNCGGLLYRVPTFGYTIKIIDFERGIASVKIAGMKESKLFMSDHFCIDEEAGGQYNYGDFYVTKHPEMKPNPSFDLVRLATSLYWDLFPEPKPENAVYKLFKKWLTLEDGNSVLFGKKIPEHDRYHGFHLYKAISRFCKDNAVPRKEIASLKEYVVSTSENNSVLMIDV
jgi:hypothetical protein